MRLTRRMGPNYRACPRGRLLRLCAWSSCLVAVLALKPLTAAPDARPEFGEDDPRIKTSAPIFFERVDTVRVTPSGSFSDVGVRTASGAHCELQSTHTDADFDGPGDFSIVFGLAETEIFAASYTIAPEFFPIEIQSVEMVFAQTGAKDTITQIELLILKGTPNQGQIVGDPIPYTLDFTTTEADAINVLIDLSADPVEVVNNGTDTFSVGFRIVEHNNQTQDPCIANPPADSNAFPTVDVSGVQNEADNWLHFINCGPLGCPAGWSRFEDLSFCEPDGDWVLRATWTSAGCDLQGACCFENGDCLEGQFESECVAQKGDFQGPETVCEPNPCPPPSQACCFAKTEGCVDLDPDFCTGVSGVPAGSDTSCDTFTCFPTGACCKPNGFCVDDVSVGECEDALLGTYQGDDTTCDNTTCPDPVGACCFNEEFCIVLTESSCEQGGATWHGPLTDCDDVDGDKLPDECQNEPIGACCLPDFTCADGQTSEACAAADGAFQGTGSECVDIGDECVAPTGACCLPAGQCLPDESMQDCVDAGGVYQGDGSDCTSCSTQACCFEGAGCLDFPVATCAAAGGSAQGAGTTCATTQCPLAEGACCFETGLCLELTLGECSQGGGSWLGADSMCEPNPCEGAALGACCLAGDECVDGLTPAECLAEPGEFQGDGTICTEVKCDVGEETEACCLDSGFCTDQTPLACTGLFGTSQGPGSTCFKTECPVVVGACCAGDGSCSEVTEADCGADSYLGDGTDCTTDECCFEDLDCDDADVCNGAETCLANVCQDGTPPADGTECNDGLFCTDTDACSNGACLGSGDPCVGPDGDDDCAESCDEASDSCTAPDPNGTECSDGEVCTENDICTDGVCGGTAADCTGAGDQCNTGSCDPAGAEGNCDILTPRPDNTPCDDENACTENDICTAGVCGGTALDCGACCLSSGNCQDEMSADDCDGVEGMYQGAGSRCAPGLCIPAVGNDLCAEAIETFDGLTDYDTTGATTDGPAHPGDCEFDGQTYHDIWYTYTAECTADTIVTTCEDLGAGADYDTDLVVYDGCDCAKLVLLGCNDDDDDANHPCGDDPLFQSTVTVPMVAGNCYMVRVGGWLEKDFGIGTLLIDPQCGACCQGDTCMENLGSGECTDIGGDYQGEDTACADIDCTVTGACCSAAGDCADTTPQACAEQNGDYQGDDTNCEAKPCPTCPQDLDGDGEVGPFDLALVLGFWGPCPEPCMPGMPETTCLTDLNGDCATGPFDLALILGFWGPCP